MNLSISRIPASVLLWGALLVVGLLGSIASTIFLFMVMAAARRYRRNAREASRATASIPSVHLASGHDSETRARDGASTGGKSGEFFPAGFPDFEIVIGARDLNNAALRIAQEVRQRYPQVKSRIVVSGPPRLAERQGLLLAQDDWRVVQPLPRNQRQRCAGRWIFCAM
jgi:hypothetical protein